MLFVHGVVHSIHHHVKAHIEDVLVDRREESRCHKRTMLRRNIRRDSSGVHNTSQFDLELDHTILVEIPVETVLVVAHRGDERDDQASRTAYLGLVRAPIDMLPEQAKVLFMHTDRIWQWHEI